MFVFVMEVCAMVVLVMVFFAVEVFVTVIVVVVLVVVEFFFVAIILPLISNLVLFWINLFLFLARSHSCDLTSDHFTEFPQARDSDPLKQCIDIQQLTLEVKGCIHNVAIHNVAIHNVASDILNFFLFLFWATFWIMVAT